MIGELLGSYRVVGTIGAGGMGTVYLGEHQLLGSRAAIKVLNPGLSNHAKIVQRFFDEAKAATRIQDPGIVTVLDFGWRGNDAYLVMEYLAGDTFAKRLGLGRLPPLHAIRLVQMCAMAMASAHARGIIHRDLKPDNILIVADPAVPGGERIKILDFGIAKLLDRDPDAAYLPTAADAMMGTPAYMSPEQCHGAGAVDHRTDIYALGCVLFQLLCGRPPFIAQTPSEMIVAQVRDAPPRPSQFVANLAPEVDALVLRCLAKDPAARFGSMTELVRAGAAITGDGHGVPTIPPLTQTTGPMLPTLPSEPHPQPLPPITTLNGSATAIDGVQPEQLRPRYGVAAILALGLVGGITAASLLGGHGRVGYGAGTPAAPTIDAAIAVDATTDGKR